MGQPHILSAMFTLTLHISTTLVGLQQHALVMLKLRRRVVIVDDKVAVVVVGGGVVVVGGGVSVVSIVMKPRVIDKTWKDTETIAAVVNIYTRFTNLL